MENKEIGNVLSLFDGMSCGQIALNKLGIKYNSYYASEIDDNAIKVTKHNYPDTIHIGSVVDVKSENLPKIDLLFGGSPCQSFSNLGNGKGFDGKSGLFWEYVRLLEETKPKYFLLENVVMKKEWEDIITNALGVKPVAINSSLLSGQSRRRLYWTNLPITVPDDKCISFNSVLDDLPYREIPKFLMGKWGDKARINNTNWVCKEKAQCVTTKNTHPTQYLLNEDKSLCRLLTAIEYERLQTVPENYTNIVSNTERYKMLGNGWTVDVIAHIFSFIK